MVRKAFVMYEVSQKQKYIFQTNRLLENIGASYIIREVTERPHQFLHLLKRRRILDLEHEDLDLPYPEESIVGGGTATYIFDEKVDAEVFSQKLSSLLLKYFPGLELFLILREYPWEEDSFIEQDETNLMMELRNTLAEKKNQRKHAVRQLSWGIHRSCINSGLPANDIYVNPFTKEKEALSEEILVKRKIGTFVRNISYKKRLLEKNPFLDHGETYEFLQQDHLEEVFDEEGKSYVAIISMDGNQMGVKVSKFFHQNFTSKEDYLLKYKKFTQDIDNAYTEALQQTISYVMNHYNRWAPKLYSNEKLLQKMENVIPIRPVIVSGDDVSLITYGRLGIEIARIFLEYLQKQTMSFEDGSKLLFNACAGVAIIRDTYPFWLGFQLADELCNHAKIRLEKDSPFWKEKLNLNKEEVFDRSLIDWHIVDRGGAITNIEDLRRNYLRTSDHLNLVMRPYYIQDSGDRFAHFASYQHTFLRTIEVIQESIKQSKGNPKFPGMSKWKELRDIYQEGKEATNQWSLLNQFTMTHPDSQKEVMKLFISYKDGFGTMKDSHDETGESFAYFYDALETYDYFIPLREVNK